LKYRFCFSIKRNNTHNAFEPTNATVLRAKTRKALTYPCKKGARKAPKGPQVATMGTTTAKNFLKSFLFHYIFHFEFELFIPGFQLYSFIRHKLSPIKA